MCSVNERCTFSNILSFHIEFLNYCAPAIMVTTKRGSSCYCEKEEVEMRKIMNAHYVTYKDFLH